MSPLIPSYRPLAPGATLRKTSTQQQRTQCSLVLSLSGFLTRELSSGIPQISRGRRACFHIKWVKRQYKSIGINALRACFCPADIREEVVRLIYLFLFRMSTWASPLICQRAQPYLAPTFVIPQFYYEDWGRGRQASVLFSESLITAIRSPIITSGTNHTSFLNTVVTLQTET